MPTKIIDFSARSRIIREEPFMLHFWESQPTEVLAFLRDPRGQLLEMGIELPDDCRIETTIENHDFLAAATQGLSKDGDGADGGTIICTVGGGNKAKNYYKVSLYAHKEGEVGRYPKDLLHDPSEEERPVPGSVP
jgi:hypothetical protein